MKHIFVLRQCILYSPDWLSTCYTTKDSLELPISLLSLGGAEDETHGLVLC